MKAQLQLHYMAKRAAQKQLPERTQPSRNSSPAKELRGVVAVQPY